MRSAVAPPENWETAKTEFPEFLSARESPRVLRFEPAWELGAAGETGPETANLATWGGESGRSPARGEKIPGAGGDGAAGFQISSFPESGHSEIFGERQFTTLNSPLLFPSQARRSYTVCY